MREKYKSSRYGVSQPLGFRTLNEIRKAEKREKEARAREEKKRAKLKKLRDLESTGKEESQ